MNVRRYYVPNQTVFITQVVNNRTPIFTHAPFIELLLETLRNVKEIHPFIMVAYVILPDHFHLLIRPNGQSNFSQIMHSLKRNFTLEYKDMIGVSGPMKFWQKSFWDHVIRDDVDFQRHLDYIHYNPVRHELARMPEEWMHSSFVQWQERNVYPHQWGWSFPAIIKEYDWQPAEDDNDE